VIGRRGELLLLIWRPALAGFLFVLYALLCRRLSLLNIMLDQYFSL